MRTLSGAKTYTAEVICLKSIDYGEADRILHLYSPERGRISAIAKGVKKPKSKLAGACELLNISQVQLSSGKNLHVLCQYQPVQTFMGIRSDLLKLAFAMLFVELVNRVAADFDMDSHQNYALLKEALHQLDQAGEADIVPIATHFQMQILETSGYHPALNQCVFSAQPIDFTERYYCFSPQLGGVTTSQMRQQHVLNSVGHQWVNVSAITLQALTEPEQVDWSCVNVLKVQRFLQYYFRQTLERELQAYPLIFQLLDSGVIDIAEDSSEVAVTAL